MAAMTVSLVASTSFWDEALGRLQERIHPQQFDMWLRPIECISCDGHVVRLRAPNGYMRNWFEREYLADVRNEVRTITGLELEIEFDPDDGPDVRSSDSRIDAPVPAIPDTPTDLPVVHAGVEIDGDSSLLLERASLNPRYTFDTFVAGPSNQLAFAASQAAASAYPPKYNPVFICGGVGLGKTHLLHAIGHSHASMRPNSRITYISSERFMNEYVTSIRTNSMPDFRRRYREGIDVLLVDDVQFLAGKDGTQDEFFHTFNALYDTHKQIVLTADRKPHEISDIADRLRSRFAWGLLADIEPPELEVRLAILRKKAMTESIPMPDDVALFIASSVKSNVRELEGALIRLAAYASLSRRTIDLPFAQETLGGAITRPREVVTSDSIIKAVASYYGVKASDIKSGDRHKSIVTPRAVAMYLARQHTSASYPDLGRAFGNKHHTTVISAVEKIAERIKDDPTLRGEIHAIESTLTR
jgi:chromosomal replication initiator protein